MGTVRAVTGNQLTKSIKEPTVNVNGEKSSDGIRRINTLGVNALARRLGVTPAHVSQVMSGKRQSRRVMEASRGQVVRLNYEATEVAV